MNPGILLVKADERWHRSDDYGWMAAGRTDERVCAAVGEEPFGAPPGATDHRQVVSCHLRSKYLVLCTPYAMSYCTEQREVARQTFSQKLNLELGIVNWAVNCDMTAVVHSHRTKASIHAPNTMMRSRSILSIRFFRSG